MLRLPIKTEETKVNSFAPCRNSTHLLSTNKRLAHMKDTVNEREFNSFYTEKYDYNRLIRKKHRRRNKEWRFLHGWDERSELIVRRMTAASPKLFSFQCICIMYLMKTIHNDLVRIRYVLHPCFIWKI